MKRTLLPLLLAACSGEASTVFDSNRGDTDVVLEQPEPEPAPEPADVNQDASARAEAAPPDASSDSSQEDAPAEDAGGEQDAEAETGLDASVEADADAAPYDAGLEKDAAPDAEADAGPPPVCTKGQARCFEYQYQKCTSNTWVWQTGDQRCCHDDRFSVSGTVVTDSKTGRQWHKYGGKGAGTQCPSLISNGRLPTTSELLDIVIGTPVSNVGVCSPTVDQQAFENVYAGDTRTSDGCVNLILGVSKVSCTESTPGFLCTAN